MKRILSWKKIFLRYLSNVNNLIKKFSLKNLPKLRFNSDIVIPTTIQRNSKWRDFAFGSTKAWKYQTKAILHRFTQLRVANVIFNRFQTFELSDRLVFENRTRVVEHLSLTVLIFEVSHSDYDSVSDKSQVIFIMIRFHQIEVYTFILWNLCNCKYCK